MARGLRAIGSPLPPGDSTHSQVEAPRCRSSRAAFPPDYLYDLGLPVCDLASLSQFLPRTFETVLPGCKLRGWFCEAHGSWLQHTQRIAQWPPCLVGTQHTVRECGLQVAASSWSGWAPGSRGPCTHAGPALGVLARSIHTHFTSCGKYAYGAVEDRTSLVSQSQRCGWGCFCPFLPTKNKERASDAKQGLPGRPCPGGLDWGHMDPGARGQGAATPPPPRAAWSLH